MIRYHEACNVSPSDHQRRCTHLSEALWLLVKLVGHRKSGPHILHLIAVLISFQIIECFFFLLLQLREYILYRSRLIETLTYKH